jgi:glutaredoxin
MLEFSVYPKEPAWLLYTKDGCDSCASAKAALQNRLQAYRMTVCPNDKKKKMKLLESLSNKAPGHKTFPFVFHKRREGEEYRFIGGWEKLDSYLNE